MDVYIRIYRAARLAGTAVRPPARPPAPALARPPCPRRTLNAQVECCHDYHDYHYY